MARIVPLFSGSTGNSYFIGSQKEGVLIDVGRSAKQTTDILHRAQIDVSAVKAIFITHEHTDHISGVRVFASKNKIPVFALSSVLCEMEKMGALSGVTYNEINEKAIEAASLGIKAYKTPHDSVGSCGYRIETSDGRKISFFTDLGHITDEVDAAMKNCDFAIIESNHDVNMLKSGPYPYFLKKRILSDYGHLSNEACAQEVKKLSQSGTSWFLLSHLSRENNTPHRAFDTTNDALLSLGLKQNTDYKLMVSPIVNELGKSIIF